jgi:hypothetical protein
MADKRISQLVERTDIANNDVLPIVASGATTTNKVTISTIQDWMQDNLDVGVTSVGLSMPSAFTVTNSPVTTSGNISVVGAGTVSQYIRGDGSLADFPQGGGGGGASVNYYLNGSVSQGTIGGIAYYEMNKTPILGTGTDFVAIADGYLASFITDSGDPSLLQIPGGNWNFETYFSASSGGGTPTFYVELYKVDSGGTATLIASNSGTPELIAFGTTITPYFSTLAVPTTTLALTDRLALRYYVARSGRTITMHTENSHLCQIITTFTTGLTALNGLTAQVQNFATGTSGSDFNISSATSTHIFNLPTATSTIRGVLSSADWSTFNGKQAALNGTGFVKISGTTISYDNSTYLTTGSAASTYLPLAGGTLTGGLNGTSANFSGSVGIGTNTPEGSGLTVASGGILVSLDPGANRKVLELYATSTGAKVSSSYVGSSSYGSLELLTSGLARLTIADTGAATFSSSVGVGLSGTPAKTLEVRGTLAISNSSSSYWYMDRDDSDGRFKILTDTDNERLSILTGGNVGIGTASPNRKLEVITGEAVTNGIRLTKAAGVASEGMDITYLDSGNTTTSFDSIYNSDSAVMRFRMKTGATAVTAMTILGSGNVGIGTASPSANLHIAGTTEMRFNVNSSGSFIQFWKDSSASYASAIGNAMPGGSVQNDLLFSTYNGSSWGERMRITSGGYLKASNTGTYNSGAIHEFYQSVNGAGATVITHAGASDPYGLEVNFPSHDPNNATNYMFGAYKTSGGFVWIYRIFSNGTVSARSDARWKKNIETTRNGYIDDLCKLRVVKYNWYNHEDDAPKELGLIAQEVEEVFPNLIQIDPVIAKREVEQEDGTIIEEEFEDGVSRSIKTSVLPFMLLKAIQEQQAQIEELKVQIDSLKN